MDHFKFSRKPAVPVRTALREGVAPLGAIVLITIGLVAVFALCLHFGADLPPVIPEHLDDGEMVDPNPLRFAFMLTAFVLSFFLARHADRQGERGKVFPAFLTGYAGGTLLWQSVGECSWHFSIVCEDYLMCFPHIEGASALFLVIITVILLNYCRKRHAFGWGVWVFVLSFVGNWFGHFLHRAPARSQPRSTHMGNFCFCSAGYGRARSTPRAAATTCTAGSTTGISRRTARRATAAACCCISESG